jgi:hypothetical protein
MWSRCRQEKKEKRIHRTTSCPGRLPEVRRLPRNRKRNPGKQPENLNEVTYSAGACTPGAFAIY